MEPEQLLCSPSVAKLCIARKLRCASHSGVPGARQAVAVARCEGGGQGAHGRRADIDVARRQQAAEAVPSRLLLLLLLLLLL
jgi:hypothetical protein